MKLSITLRAAACLVLCAASVSAFAQVKVGVIVSATGPAASIGVPERRVVDFMPRTVAGKSIEFMVMDDATDTNLSVKAGRKLMADDKVDVLIGSSASAPSIALVDVAAEFKTPMISMASSSRITSPVDDKRKWVFKVVMDEALMVESTLHHLKSKGIKTLAVIASSDAYGDVWMAEAARMKDKFGIDIVATERYASSDVSVLAQVAKVLSKKPESVLIAAAGTPAALPHKTLKQRGYKGQIVQTFGAFSPEVLKIGGKDMEGTLLASSLGTVTEQMPVNHPARIATEELNKRYEQAVGPGSYSPYAANSWSAWAVLEDALKRLPASVKPGTQEFRTALRDQIELTKDLPTASGIITMSPSDHMGFDMRSTAMFELKNGAWTRIGQ